MSDLSLRIGSDIHRGWTEVRVQRSIEQVADTFDLSLTDFWGANDEARAIRAGEPCQVRIDDQPVITGYIDDVLPEYDGEQHTVTVTGRSKTADLVDCSGRARQFKKQDLAQIARKLADPFGVDVVVNADVGEPFESISLEPGQPYFELLEELARIRALRLNSDPEGRLLITRTGTGRAGTPLVLGENVRSASGSFSIRDRFDTYVVQGQRSGSDNSWGNDAAEPEAESVDTGVQRHRPTLVMAEGQVDIAACQKRAKWQRNTAFGRSRGITYTVDGWHHADGLWQPNTKVRVDDHWLGVDGEMLIAGVQMLLDNQGERTELRVAPPEAYDLIELPEPESGGDGGWG